MNATITIQELPKTSGFPHQSWSVTVRKPNGGLIDGAFGFRDLSVAEVWGRGRAKVAGFADPVVTTNRLGN